MKIKPATKKDKELFKEWREQSRMEEITCRGIRDGKHYVDPTLFSFSLFMDDIKEPIGKFDCFNMNKRNKSGECGYMTNPKYRGKGYGLKMVKYCVSYLFKNYDFNKLYCQTGFFNKPSVDLLEELGFHRDGVLREHHELDGKLYDDYIYSILRYE